MIVPTRNEWLGAELLSEPQKLFVLSAIKESFCRNLEDFHHHFGEKFQIDSIVSDLRQRGFLTTATDRLALTEVGYLATRFLEPSAPSSTPASPPLVYVDAHKDDLSNGMSIDVGKIAEYLTRNNVSVVARSVDDHGPERRYRDMTDLWRGEMILHGNCPQDWLVRRVMKARETAISREHPLTVGVYLGSSLERRRTHFHFPPEVLVLDCRDGFDPERLQPFLESIQWAP